MKLLNLALGLQCLESLGCIWKLLAKCLIRAGQKYSDWTAVWQKMSFWLDWNIPQEHASFDENYWSVLFLPSWSFWYDEFSMHGIMKGKMATMKWRIAAFTEMLHFDKIIFIIFSKLILKGGWGWQGQLCREMSKARLIRKHFTLSNPVFKNLQILGSFLVKHSLPPTLPTSAAQFSHAPHPSHWVTSLPSSKKLLLETCCVTGVSSVPAKGPFQVCFSQEGIQGKTSMTNRCPGEVGPGERRHAIPEQSLFCWNYWKARQRVRTGCCTVCRDTGAAGNRRWFCGPRMKPLRLILQGKKQGMHPWVFVCAPWQRRTGDQIKRQAIIGWWGIPLAQSLIKFGLPCREADLSGRLPKRD